MKITEDTFRLVANTIRCLCADMIEKAKSGHPGAAMGMADLASVLWLKHLNVDPKDPSWAERDRLVFSGGHASSLGTISSSSASGAAAAPATPSAA